MKPLYEWEIRDGAKPPPVKNIAQVCRLKERNPRKRGEEKKNPPEK
jgi:hypothetical protein